MTSAKRRLTLLEGRVRPHPTPREFVQRAFLDTLPDADLDVLEAVLSVRQEGGDESAIPASTLERFDVLQDAWQRYQANTLH